MARTADGGSGRRALNCVVSGRGRTVNGARSENVRARYRKGPFARTEVHRARTVYFIAVRSVLDYIRVNAIDGLGLSSKSSPLRFSSESFAVNAPARTALPPSSSGPERRPVRRGAAILPRRVWPRKDKNKTATRPVRRPGRRKAKRRANPPARSGSTTSDVNKRRCIRSRCSPGLSRSALPVPREIRGNRNGLPGILLFRRQGQCPGRSPAEVKMRLPNGTVASTRAALSPVNPKLTVPPVSGSMMIPSHPSRPPSVFSVRRPRGPAPIPRASRLVTIRAVFDKSQTKKHVYFYWVA